MNPEPRIVRQWVDDLPLINTDRSRTLLAEALGEISALDLTAANRYEIHEMLTAPVACVTASLKKTFLEKPVPLQDTQRLLVSQTVDLCNHMATGYRKLTDEFSENNRRRVQLTVAIHRALRYLSEILLIHYQLYIQYPAGLWKSIHTLYALAEQRNLTARLISDATLSRPVQSTIGTVYKQVLLLSLACPCRLGQQQIQSVYHSLMDWADSTRLYDMDDSYEHSLCAINLDSDAPPACPQPRNGNTAGRHWRWLDTLSMADHIRDFSDKQPRNTRRHTGIGDTGLVQHLLPVWGAMPVQRFRRHDQSNRVGLVVGLIAIHRRLTDPETEMVGKDDSIDDQHYLLNPTFAALPAVTGNQPDETGRPVVTPAKKQDSASKPAAAPVEDWKVVNLSAGGYRLLRDSLDSSSARVGELVAIIEQDNPAEACLQPGVVRWIKCSDVYGLELGIQMLAPGARATWACLEEAGVGAGSRMQGILLPDIKPLKQQASLLLPTLPFRTGCNVTLQSTGLLDSIRLTRQLESTGSFARYHFAAAVTP